MPMIRVSKLTHDTLVGMKHGNDSLDIVIRVLIEYWNLKELTLGVKEHERKAVEAKGAGHGPSPGGKKSEYVRPQKP
jgi:hypothetical protein